ncbi:MAG: BMC domain-containing protein [Planctomycetota bacterium]
MTDPRPLRLAKPLPHDTLGAIELSSIAQGVLVLDSMVKESPIHVHWAQPATAGKYLVLFTGEVEEAARALTAGVRLAGDALIDEVLLPAAARSLQRALITGNRSRLATPLPALGILETFSAPSLLGATDVAAKTGEVAIEEVHLLQGIGGKSTSIFSGDLESVRVALEAGASFARDRELLARDVLIPRPDAAILPFLLRD